MSVTVCRGNAVYTLRDAEWVVYRSSSVTFVRYGTWPSKGCLLRTKLRTLNKCLLHLLPGFLQIARLEYASRGELQSSIAIRPAPTYAGGIVAGFADKPAMVAWSRIILPTLRGRSKDVTPRPCAGNRRQLPDRRWRQVPASDPARRLIMGARGPKRFLNTGPKS